MKKNLNKGKPLFGETSSADHGVKLNKVVKEDKPKRGRPKKTTTITEPKNEKVAKPKQKQQPIKPITKKRVQDQADKNGKWKDFSTSKPEYMKPCEFYVDTGKDKIDIFYGYVERAGVTVTDEPYKMRVLRKKYGNLHYREVKDCQSVNDCPNGFPHCDKCKKKN